MSDLADRLAATLRHLSTDAAPHRRLELARMTALTEPDHVHRLIDRLESARNQARHFGLEVDDQASDFDRADALRRHVREAGDYPIACLATALDELPELSRDAQAALAALLTELAAERSRAPSREWWADAAQIAGRGCVSLPDAMAAFKAAIAAKDAEIARLKSETVHAALGVSSREAALTAMAHGVPCPTCGAERATSTVGGLLPQAVGGFVVEFIHPRDDGWRQIVKGSTWLQCRWWHTADSKWGPWFSVSYQIGGEAFAAAARLVTPGAADAAPDTRGPIGGAQ